MTPHLHFHPARRQDSWRRRLSEGVSERPLLLYVGRLSLEQRVHWLRPLLEAVPEARLAIVGDGPMRPALEHMFAGLPVCFTGYLTGADLADAYAAADVFVFPAHNETFDNAVAEAMASGLPVVAARSGGVEEQVVPDVTGLLFAAESQPPILSPVQLALCARSWPACQVHAVDTPSVGALSNVTSSISTCSKHVVSQPFFPTISLTASPFTRAPQHLRRIARVDVFEHFNRFMYGDRVADCRVPDVSRAIAM